MREVRSVARAPPEYGNCIAGFHRIACPSLPSQHIGRKSFKLPLDHFAGVVLHVQIKMDVRILPVHFSDNARDRDWLGVVVFGAKRVMSENWSRSEDCKSGGEQVSSHTRPAVHYITHPAASAVDSPKTRSALVWYSFFLSSALMGRSSVTFTSSGTNW